MRSPGANNGTPTQTQGLSPTPLAYSHFFRFLQKQYSQSSCHVSLIQEHSTALNFTIHESIALAFVLKIILHIPFNTSQFLVNLALSLEQPPPIIADLIQFYKQPEISPRQIKFSSSYFTTQLLSPPTVIPPNYFDALSSKVESDLENMDIDSPSPSQSTKVIASWTMEAGASELSDDIFSHLQQMKQGEDDAGENEADAPTYIKPQHQ